MTLRGSARNASILSVDAIPSGYRERRSGQRMRHDPGAAAGRGNAQACLRGCAASPEAWRPDGPPGLRLLVSAVDLAGQAGDPLLRHSRRTGSTARRSASGGRQLLDTGTRDGWWDYDELCVNPAWQAASP